MEKKIKETLRRPNLRKKQTNTLSLGLPAFYLQSEPALHYQLIYIQLCLEALKQFSMSFRCKISLVNKEQ